MIDETPEGEEFVSFGKSWEDLEAELGDGEPENPAAGLLPEPKKLFYLTKAEIAEFAYNASLDFREMVSAFENDGEPTIQVFTSLSDEEQKDWTEVAGLALNMQGDPSDDNFARLVHAKTSMGLLKDGIRFDEKFDQDERASPMVAPWECLPHERRIPLLIFKSVCRQLFRVWDRDNELLKR